MNIFRLCADLLHLFSFIVLILRLYATKSSAGISLKSQELFLLVWCTRYLDLFTTYISLYNSFMKTAYISLSAIIVYGIRFREPWSSTRDASLDSFLHIKFAVLPCAVLALIVNHGYTFMEILWTFSIYLEAVAIVPQLIMLQRHGEVENLTGHYMACTGGYRALYILNWIYRFFTEYHYRAWIVWVAGIVQTALYADFFYYYTKSRLAGLPTTTIPK
mmetsp:Transcript_3263/g.6191  ORF Transcript_3263/g.6191 Transcript_3263/m.6191 type:complete len:218 (+) Transcript_3263:33-686(+)